MKFKLPDEIKRLSGIPITEEVGDKEILKYGELGLREMGTGLVNGLEWIGYTDDQIETILKSKDMKTFFESKGEKISHAIFEEVVDFFGKKKKVKYASGICPHDCCR